MARRVWAEGGRADGAGRSRGGRGGPGCGAGGRSSSGLFRQGPPRAGGVAPRLPSAAAIPMFSVLSSACESYPGVSILGDTFSLESPPFPTLLPHCDLYAIPEGGRSASVVILACSALGTAQVRRFWCCSVTDRWWRGCPAWLLALE